MKSPLLTALEVEDNHAHLLLRLEGNPYHQPLGQSHKEVNNVLNCE